MAGVGALHLHRRHLFTRGSIRLFVTHLSLSGTDNRTAKELLDHRGVPTAMSYTYVLKVAAGGMASPLDVVTLKGYCFA